MKALPFLVGPLLVLAGLAVIVGWLTQNEILTCLFRGFLCTKVESGLAMISLGLGYALLRKEKKSGPRIFWGRCFALIPITMGLGLVARTLLWPQHVMNLFPVESLPVARNWTGVQGSFPLMVSCNFVLSGLGLLLIDARNSHGGRPSQWIALMLGLGWLVTTMGYAFALSPHNTLVAYLRVSMISAIAVGLMSLGLFLARPEGGLVSTVMSRRMGGFLARRLILIALFLPFALGALVLKGHHLGYYSFSHSFILFAALDTAFLITIIWNYACTLNNIDVERRAAEDQFRLLSDSLPQIVWTCDSRGNIDYINRRWLEFSGFSDGIEWKTVMHPEDQVLSAERWRDAVREGVPYEVEARLKGAADGAYKWFLLRAVPMRDDGGHHLKWCGTSTDIDEQKRDNEFEKFIARAGDALSAGLSARATLVSLANWSLGLFADACLVDIVQADGSITRTSVFRADFADDELKALLLDSRVDLDAPDGISAALRAGTSILRSAQNSESVFFRIGTNDLSTVEALARLGVKSYMTVLVRDGSAVAGAFTFLAFSSGGIFSEGDLKIADRIARRAGYSIERARLNREKNDTLQLLDTLLEAAPAGFAFLNADLEIKRINRSLATTVGEVPENLRGRKVDEILPHLMLVFGPIFKRVLKTGAPLENFDISEDSFAADSQGRHWLASFYPIPDPQGGTAGVGVVSVDVSDSKRTEIELKNAKEEAESANRAKTHFLANMSHEIRTPLGAMLGFSEMMADPALPLDERTEYAATIRRNGQQLIKLIDEILDLSKVESGRFQIENVVLDFNELLFEVRHLLLPQAYKKGLNLELQAPDSLPKFIKSDPLRLRQILLNVLANSLKFTERGGVSLRVNVLDHVPGLESARLVFVVKDSGIGIPRDQQKNLFQPFSQADGSTSRTFGGTGLGLVLARHLARLLGGDLVLTDSREGEGSTFTVTIEVGLVKESQTSLPSESPPLNLGSSAPSSSLAGVRILLVEDSPDNQYLVKFFLSAAGAEMSVASDGEQGIQKALTDNPDIVLMDIQMPVLDGYAATLALRQKGFKRPIIALTAHALNEERQRALDTGFTDHVTKPLNRHLLIEKIHEHIVCSRGTARAPELNAGL